MAPVAPLKSTASIFDESVLKVEFLPMPVQFTDFSLNLNTEAMLYRLKMIMEKIVGSIRVEGMAVRFNENVPSSPVVELDPGLVMVGPYFVRVSTMQTFAFPRASRVLYAQISLTLLTNQSDPATVNVNPPLAPSSLPGPNQYRYGVNLHLDTAVPFDTATNVYVRLASLNAGGDITNTLPLLSTKLGGLDFSDVADTSHTSKLGTRSSSFVVGYGSLNGGQGYKVELEDYLAPMAPLNLRVTDMLPRLIRYSREDVMPGVLSLKAKRGDDGHEVDVFLEWNWTSATGTGTGATFTFAPGLTLGSNALIGGWLYIPQLSKDYEIKASTATSGGNVTLTLADSDGVAPAFSGLSVTSGNPATLHSGSETYEVQAIPYKQDGTSLAIEDRIETNVKYVRNSPALGYVRLPLAIGERYLIRVRALRRHKASAWTDLPAGSFTKYSATQTYTVPLLVKYPNIPAASTSLSMETTQSGFAVAIVGWDDATEYELVCAPNDGSGSNADFANDAHTHVVSRHRRFNVATVASGSYSVKVRPLVGGQAVGTEMNGVVSAGGHSINTQDVLIKKATPALSLQQADGTDIGKVLGRGTKREVVVQAWDPVALALADLIKGNMEDKVVEIPDASLKVGGQEMASKQYVQDRVRSSSHTLGLYGTVDIVSNASYQVAMPGASQPFLMVPEGAFLRQIRLLVTIDDYSNPILVQTFPAAFAFGSDFSLVNGMAIFTNRGSNQYDFRFTLTAAKIPENDGLLQQVIFDTAVNTDLQEVMVGSSGTYIVMATLVVGY